MMGRPAPWAAVQPNGGDLACRPAVALGSIPDHAKFLAGLAFENFVAAIAFDLDASMLPVDHFFAFSPTGERFRP
jgi:hypothetical protein